MHKCFRRYLLTIMITLRSPFPFLRASISSCVARQSLRSLGSLATTLPTLGRRATTASEPPRTTNGTSLSHHCHGLGTFQTLSSTPGRRIETLKTNTPTLRFLGRHFSAVATQQQQQEVPSTSTNNTKTIPYLLADIGEGIKEVELLQWFVKPGDFVHEFDTICQVQSDKATVDITSRYHGVVHELGAPVGEMIQVGSPLLFLETEQILPAANGTHRPVQQEVQESAGSDKGASAALPNPSKGTINGASHRPSDVPPPIETTPNVERQTVLTSPAVRKLAADYQIDLRSTVKGTGPAGRILKQDVMEYVRQQGLVGGDSSTPPDSVAVTPAAELSHAHVIQPSVEAIIDAQGDEIIQLKGYHRYMVKSMTQALEIPHMTLGDEVVLDEIMVLRQRLEPNAPHISMLAFMLKACSLALTEFPMMNASIHSLEHCELQVHHYHHLGVAMDTPRGLVVPAVQNVQDKSLLEIQSTLDHLKEQARSGQVDASVLNPTFTISNVGALGVGTTMSAVLAPPQVAMGVLGRVQRVPRFASSDSLQVQAVHVASISWTGDHRFLDGATLARFHKKFASFLENPVNMLLHCK